MFFVIVLKNCDGIGFIFVIKLILCFVLTIINVV